jgi:hypothetical protein
MILLSSRSAQSQSGSEPQCHCPPESKTSTTSNEKKSSPPKEKQATKKPEPKKAEGCDADHRTCQEKSEDQARLEEADAYKKAKRWNEASAKFLDAIKNAVDERTRTRAIDGYRETIKIALELSAEDQARLLEAKTERAAERWDKAAEKYLEALRHAPDEVHQKEAREGYEEAVTQMMSRWWRWGKSFPPIWWAHLYWEGIAFGLLAIALPVSSRYMGGDGLLGPVSRLSRLILRPPQFNGGARILAATTLTDDAPGKLFTAQLPHSANEVRKRWERVGVSFLSGATTLLSVPTTVANQIASEIPDIKGINVGKFAAWLLLVDQYFRWRVESQVGFTPDLHTEKGEKGPGRMRAYATLRWAWYVKGSYAVSPKATHAGDFEKAAYAIAARVLGAAQRKD